MDARTNQATCASWAESRPIKHAPIEAHVSEWRVWGFRLALKITGCPEAAEDALQDALLRALRHAKTLKDSAAGSAWFRRIVVRCAMDQLRARRFGDLSEARHTPYAPLEENLQVRATLAQLKPQHRAILALAIGEGLSYEEIAHALGIALGTVGSRLHDAKQAFKSKWEGQQ